MFGAPKISEYEQSCLNCDWFRFREGYRHVNSDGTVSRGNRVCQCPAEQYRVVNGVCKGWKDTRTWVQRLRGEKVMKGFC